MKYEYRNLHTYESGVNSTFDIVLMQKKQLYFFYLNIMHKIQRTNGS